MAIVQLSGHLTIAQSRGWDKKIKEEILKASEGKERALRLLLIDSDGNEVAIQGRLYESQRGSLTARFACRLDKAEIVEVDDIPEGEIDEAEAASIDDLATNLGL